jgi:glycosyltransferase involved in cell wall biosynthesis
MRQLHILDPQLVDQGGHYLNYCSLAVREARARGFAVSIHARRGCQVACEGIQPLPVFSHDIFREIGRDPQVWALENFHAVNHAFVADLGRIDTTRMEADDLLFFPTLNQNQLYGIALWLARIPAPRRPAVAVLLRYLTPEMDYVKGRANHGMLAHLFRYAAQALLGVQARTVFCADTREMSDAFQNMLGCPVLEVPVAMDPPVRAAVSVAARGARPNVVYPGHMSQLKGFHLMPEIIRTCLGHAPRPRFTVQIQNRSQRGFEPLVQWFDRQPASEVSLVEGALTPETYYGLISGADVVLLPYAPSFYGRCSSGVFAEAAALGKVLVVPEGTVAARQAREFDLGAVVAAAWTAPALAEAVGTAVREHGRLQAKAAAAADRFRAAQSAGSFWSRLLAALPEAGRVAA